MKKFSKLILVFGFLLGISSSLVTPGFAQKPPDSTPEYVPGEILVKFQSHVNRQAAQRSLQSADMRVAEVSPYSGIIHIQVEPGREQETVDELLARGDVEFATVNHYVQAHEVPDDTYYGYQWALPKIEAPTAWDISTGSSNVIIAILDSGVDLDHPDLQVNIVPGTDIVNGDSNPDDDYGHGTHVAGIAAGIGNNSIGIAGVSWGAKIMPVKVLNSSGGGETADVAEGIIWAADNGANIINMSLGARGSSWPCGWDDIEKALNHAVGKGVLVVVSAGNDGQYGVNCPGAYDQVMAVGSTTSSDSRSYFSNYGPRLDIVAPGSSIYSTVRNTYDYNSGTSMAAPHVSGLAALIWSVIPSLSRAEVIDLIQDNAVDLGTPGWDQYFGHGRINAGQTLQTVNSLILQSSPSQVTLFLDDEQDETSGIVQVNTLNTDVITWTATISPAVSWLNISPISSTISAASSPTLVTLMAQTGTLTYTDTPTNTTLVITGTAASGANLTTSSDIQLIYQSEIFEYYFPLIFKN